MLDCLPRARKTHKKDSGTNAPLRLAGSKWHKETLGRHFPPVLARSEDTGLAQPLSRKGGVCSSHSPKQKGWSCLEAQGLQSKEPCFTLCSSTNDKCSSYGAFFPCPAGSWGTVECGQRHGSLLWEGASQAWPHRTVKSGPPGQELPSVEWAEVPPGQVVKITCGIAVTDILPPRLPRPSHPYAHSVGVKFQMETHEWSSSMLGGCGQD